MAKNNTTDNFSPGGKPILRIFTNFHSTFSDDKNASAFEVNRAYLGYAYDFSRKFSATAIVDLADQVSGSLKLDPQLKNAFVRYNHGRADVHFGIIPTTLSRLQDKSWGYRYIGPSFLDAYKFYSSADLGASLDFDITNFWRADLIVANGEGYKSLEADSTLRMGIGTTVLPLKGLTCRLYYDYSHNEITLSTFSSFIGCQMGKFSLCAEYNMQKNHKFREGRDLYGISVYTSIKSGRKVKLFGRYDNLWSSELAGENIGWNVADDGELFMVGAEYVPVKGIRLSPNFSGWNPEDSAQPFSSTIRLSCEVNF